jgi:fatty acid desaturase
MNLSLFLAAVIAALLNMCVGALWYTPALFGKMWAKELGIKTGKITKQNMTIPLLISFASSLIMAYVLLLIPRAFGGNIGEMIISVVVVWVGFVAAVRATHYGFEKRSLKLFLITSFQDLAGLLVMALFFWYYF